MASTPLATGFRIFGRSLSGAALLAALYAPRAARADAKADSERANSLFKKGKSAFNQGKYSDALRIYNEAWQLKQSPDIAANLAQTEAELGQHRSAAEHYSFALAHLLPSSTDEQKQALAEGLEAEKQQVATLHVTLEPADSALSVDEAPVVLPSSGDVYIEPGEHRTSVTHEGYEGNQQKLQVSKGASQVLWIKLVEVGAVPTSAPAALPVALAAPPLSPPAMPNQSERSIAPAVVGGALVVAGVAVGVAFMLSGNSSQDDADGRRAMLPGDHACGAGTPNAKECNALHDDNESVDSARTFEVAGFTVAGAAAVASALYLLWPHSNSVSHSGAASRRLTPAFDLSRGAGSVGFAGRF